MKSLTARQLERQIRTLLSDGSEEDEPLEISRTFTDDDIIEVSNMTNRMYCVLTERTMQSVSKTITSGVASIPLDNLRLKKAVIESPV